MDIVQGAHFRNVDTAPAPHGLLATLDAVAAREGVRRLKQRGLDLLAVAAGQRLLDVGGRAGDDVRALASLVGPADPASDPATCWPTAGYHGSRIHGTIGWLVELCAVPQCVLVLIEAARLNQRMRGRCGPRRF